MLESNNGITCSFLKGNGGEAARRHGGGVTMTCRRFRRRIFRKIQHKVPHFYVNRTIFKMLECVQNEVGKGQLISKGLFGVFIFPKTGRKQVTLQSLVNSN